MSGVRIEEIRDPELRRKLMRLADMQAGIRPFGKHLTKRTDLTDRGAAPAASGKQGHSRTDKDRRTWPKQPNKTEWAYCRNMFPPGDGREVRFEAVSFRMANGHKYTPDWVVVEGGRPVECHEVKGKYRLGSLQRARLAFDQARIEWPGIRWFWNGEEQK